MSNICYHSFKGKKGEGKNYSCFLCGHSIKPQNLYKVACPNCEEIIVADVNLGVQCMECGEQFEAFESDDIWHID